MKRSQRKRKRKSRNLLLVLIIIGALSASSILLINTAIASMQTTSANTDIDEASGDKPDATSDNTQKQVTAVTDKILTAPKVAKEALPSVFPAYKTEVLKEGKTLKEYKANEEVVFPESVEYNAVEGVTCFRGNNYRDSASFGTADIRTGKLKALWSVRIGYIDEWTGVGWNGQPSIIKWDDNMKQKMNIITSKKAKEGLKEVIYATLDGKIYFLDLEDGKPTRSAIDTGYPHKGSVVIDPRGYPLLYAGQGIPTKAGKPVPIGYRIFSLINQKPLTFINGMDKDAFRHWGAFDSGGLLDVKRDTYYECGENGILYSIKLNTAFDTNKGTIGIKPEITKFRYRSPFGTKIGTENSPVIYKNYIYFADNSGLLQCIDLNTMKPVWVRSVTDDTDSSSALDVISDSEVYLYTACELDRQGANGYSHIRKFNALTGKLMWQKSVKAFYDSHTNGGALASPIIGKNDISNLVIYNICKTGKNGTQNNGSSVMAFDKETGKEVWKYQMKNYSWSSPVSIYTKKGKSYIIQCDSAGYMRLLEGTTGKELDCIPLGANIEASPAVFDNMAVVGTRGQKIWGVRID